MRQELSPAKLEELKLESNLATEYKQRPFPNSITKAQENRGLLRHKKSGYTIDSSYLKEGVSRGKYDVISKIANCNLLGCSFAQRRYSGRTTLRAIQAE
jgi:hypothetical protein